MGTPEDPFARQVQAELEAIGFRVVVVEATTDPVSRATLEAAARKAGAVAAIRGVPSEDGIEVWIADRVTGKTVLRQVNAAGSERGSAALRVVELLRASMLETALPKASEGDVPATPDITEKLLPPSPLAGGAPTLRLSAGLGALGSPGGFASALSAEITLAWMPTEHFGIAALGAFSLTRPSFQATNEGSANLWSMVSGAGGRFLFPSRASVWAPSIDVGLAAVVLTSEGLGPVPGLRANTSTSATPAPYLRFGLAYAITPTVRVQIGALASLVSQGVQVQFAGRTVATWGRPILGASLGVDLGVL